MVCICRLAIGFGLCRTYDGYNSLAQVVTYFGCHSKVRLIIITLSAGCASRLLICMLVLLLFLDNKTFEIASRTMPVLYQRPARMKHNFACVVFPMHCLPKAVHVCGHVNCMCRRI